MSTYPLTGNQKTGYIYGVSTTTLNSSYTITATVGGTYYATDVGSYSMSGFARISRVPNVISVNNIEGNGRYGAAYSTYGTLAYNTDYTTANYDLIGLDMNQYITSSLLVGSRRATYVMNYYGGGYQAKTITSIIATWTYAYGSNVTWYSYQQTWAPGTTFTKYNDNRYYFDTGIYAGRSFYIIKSSQVGYVQATTGTATSTYSVSNA